MSFFKYYLRKIKQIYQMINLFLKYKFQVIFFYDLKERDKTLNLRKINKFLNHFNVILDLFPDVKFIDIFPVTPFYKTNLHNLYKNRHQEINLFVFLNYNSLSEQHKSYLNEIKKSRFFLILIDSKNIQQYSDYNPLVYLNLNLNNIKLFEFFLFGLIYFLANKIISKNVIKFKRIRNIFYKKYKKKFKKFFILQQLKLNFNYLIHIIKKHLKNKKIVLKKYLKCFFILLNKNFKKFLKIHLNSYKNIKKIKKFLKFLKLKKLEKKLEYIKKKLKFYIKIFVNLKFIKKKKIFLKEFQFFKNKFKILDNLKLITYYINFFKNLKFYIIKCRIKYLLFYLKFLNIKNKFIFKFLKFYCLKKKNKEIYKFL